jgi:hypothetical protein
MGTFRRITQWEHFGGYRNGNISENTAMGTFRRIPQWYVSFRRIPHTGLRKLFKHDGPVFLLLRNPLYLCLSFFSVDPMKYFCLCLCLLN